MCYRLLSKCLKWQESKLKQINKALVVFQAAKNAYQTLLEPRRTLLSENVPNEIGHSNVQSLVGN